MAIRNDITVNWEQSPRIVQIAAPSVELTVQDLHDTLRSLEEGVTAKDDPTIIDSAGKEDLGGGVTVGITSTLQNAQVQFEGRTTATETGTCTSNDTTGQTLLATGGLFQTNNVARGDTVFNSTTGAMATILNVVSDTELFSQVLSGGSRQDWQSTDAYTIYENVQCSISGGNLVAIDDVRAAISSVLQSPNTNVVRTASSSATLQNQTQLEAGLFNEGVAIHPIEGYSGTGYAPDGAPIGTRGAPSNNTVDAETIAHSRFLNKYYILESISLGAGEGFGGENHIVVGDSATNIILTAAADADMSNCDFRNLVLVGVFDPGFIARECLIGSVSDINGHLYNCSLQGPIVLAADTAIQGCWTAPDDGFEVVDIDFNSLTVDCDVSGFQGGRIVLKNMVTGSSIYFTGQGELTIDASCTGGIVRAYGDVRVINNGTLDTLDDYTTHGDAKYLEKAVWIDTSLIPAGDGSQEFPFNTTTAAIDYAEANGIRTLYVHDDIVLDRQLKNFTIEGIGVPTIDCNGQNLNKSRFSHCRLEGTYTGEITAQECALLTGFTLNGFFENCGLGGDLTCLDGSNVLVKDCASIIPGLSRPTISMNGAGTVQLSLRNYSGGMTIKDCNSPTDTVTVEVAQGSLTFDNSCVDGQMVARGMCKFVNETNGATVTDETGNPANINISDKILRNKTETDPATGIMTVYEADGTTVAFTANIWENVAGTDPYAGNAVNRRDRLA